jgi:PhnB protein
MQVRTYLDFGGRCEEALAFYKKAVGAEVTNIIRMKDSPDPEMKAPPGREEQIMHSEFKIGETTLMASDGMEPGAKNHMGTTLSLHVADDAEAKRVFAAMSDGGSVQVPLMKTFWSSSWGMLTDRFGVPWMVNVGT